MARLGRRQHPEVTKNENVFHLNFQHLFDFKNVKSASKQVPIENRHVKMQVEMHWPLKMEIRGRQGQMRQLLTQHPSLRQQAQVS